MISKKETITFLWSKLSKLHKKDPILHVATTFSLKQGETRTSRGPIPHPLNTCKASTSQTVSLNIPSDLWQPLLNLFLNPCSYNDRRSNVLSCYTLHFVIIHLTVFSFFFLVFCFVLYFWFSQITKQNPKQVIQKKKRKTNKQTKKRQTKNKNKKQKQKKNKQTNKTNKQTQTNKQTYQNKTLTKYWLLHLLFNKAQSH